MSTPPTIAPPVDIKANTQAAALEITWPGGQVDRHAFAALRAACPCANCVDEWTGARILDPATIPLEIKITAMQLVGNYALKIVWSDGHDTGLYTWKKLREIAPSR
jgi:DUF971 family protein